MKQVGYRGVTTQLLYIIYMNAVQDMRRHTYDDMAVHDSNINILPFSVEGPCTVDT